MSAFARVEISSAAMQSECRRPKFQPLRIKLLLQAPVFYSTRTLVSIIFPNLVGGTAGGGSTDQMSGSSLPLRIYCFATAARNLPEFYVALGV